MQLTEVEARVVAALVEKERTTPESYPLTTNSLVAACNQKTSRNPVMTLAEADVDDALLSLRQRQMARTIRETGARTHKHRHTLETAFGLDDKELAVMAVLMLRGAQTPGELRTRTERYVELFDLDAVETTLDRLAARDEPLVRNIGRSPGQSQDRWLQLAAVGSVESTPVPSGATPTPRPAAAPVFAAAHDDDLADLKAEVADLRRLVDEMRAELGY